MADKEARGMLIEAVKSGGFDVDVWHVINERDNQLVAEEVLYGAISNKFVYSFNAGGGETAAGVSVIGARHLAHAYGGVEHRLISSTHKVKRLFTFTTYPYDGQAMSVSAQIIPELEDEPDGYACVVEIRDVKNGNKLQVEVFESRAGVGRNGKYDKPHYVKIAQAKAFRNGVLAVLPQDVVLGFMVKGLEFNAQLSEQQRKNVNITSDIIEERRAGVIAYATQLQIPLRRDEVMGWSMSQLDGLKSAIKDGGPDRFKQSVAVLRAGGDVQTGEVKEQGSGASGSGASEASGAGGQPASQQGSTGSGAGDGHAGGAGSTPPASQATGDGAPAGGDAGGAAADGKQKGKGGRPSNAAKAAAEAAKKAQEQGATGPAGPEPPAHGQEQQQPAGGAPAGPLDGIGGGEQTKPAETKPAETKPAAEQRKAPADEDNDDMDGWPQG